EAGMSISAPVAGLRPLVALRCVAAKVPKPTRRTSSPPLSAEVMASKTASTAAAAWALVRSAFSATAALRSFLFIAFPHNDMPIRRRDERKRHHPFTIPGQKQGKLRDSGGFGVQNTPKTHVGSIVASPSRQS